MIPPYVVLAAERFTMFSGGLLLGLSFVTGLEWLGYLSLVALGLWFAVIRPARKRILESYGVPQ